jgi:hypothetical protein
MESFYVIKCKFGKNLPSKRETIKLEEKTTRSNSKEKKWKKRKNKNNRHTYYSLLPLG